MFQRAAIAVKDAGVTSTTYIFRSYIHQIMPGTNALNPDNIGCELNIVQVARATSAAPGYFKKVEINKYHKFMDGGVRANNPSAVAWNEVVQMAKIQDPNITTGKAIGCFISIGTGTSHYQIFGGKDKTLPPKSLHLYQSFKS